MRPERSEIGAASLNDDRLQAQRSHLGAGAAAGIDRFRSGHDAGAERQVLPGGGDRRQAVVFSFHAMEIARNRCAEIEVVHTDPRPGVDELHFVVFNVQQRPLPRFSVEHEMVDAVQLHE